MTLQSRVRLALQLALCLFIKMLCRCSLLRKKYSEIWLFSERGFDACDNAWSLFWYVRNTVPEKKVYYILEPSSPAVKKVILLGSVLRRGSLRHLFLYFLPTAKISTHILGASPYPVLFTSSLGRRLLHVPGVSVFLQHGITKDDIPALYAANTKVDLFVCGAFPECEFVKTRFGYPQNAVCCPGFARFDSLLSAYPARQILFLPTWRSSLAVLSDAEFKKTSYFSALQTLLSHKELMALLTRENVKLVFSPHPEMKKFVHLFEIHSGCISMNAEDIGAAIRQSAVLITDFSSVMFDFAYAERPVVYLETEGLNTPNYPMGYFSRERDGFGPVVRDHGALCDTLADMIRRKFSPDKKYLARAKHFFPRRDRENCRRNFEAISECIAKKRGL